jgi:hypothetical protein
MSHFLFVAGALRERTSEESAELQLRHSLWGLCTGLIRINLQTYLDPGSHGLVYVLKAGLCAEFEIVPPVLDFSALDAFLGDELKTEAMECASWPAPLLRVNRCCSMCCRLRIRPNSLGD